MDGTAEIKHETDVNETAVSAPDLPCENCATILCGDKAFNREDGSCVTCYGILNLYLRPYFVQSIIDCAKNSGCDAKNFSFSFKIPEVVFLSYFLSQKLQGSNKFSIDTAFCRVKELYKELLCQKLNVLSPGFVNHKSIATINIEFYSDSPNIFSQVFEEKIPKKEPELRKRTFWKMKHSKWDNDDSGVLNRNQFVQHVNSFIEPNHDYCKSLVCYPVVKADTFVTVDSIFIGGRYLKFSRTLSQTPWFIRGKRKGDNSLEELISDPIKNISGAKNTMFRSSGREDIDARMLGNGRPFAVELLNPRKTCFSESELLMLTEEINLSKQIEVRFLHIVNKNLLGLLKDGELNKRKEYAAIIYSEVAFSQDDLEKLTISEEFVMQQQTPIRVLHRRTLSTRPKIIHSVTPERLDAHHVTLRLCTEAGAYVKEFVHGDLGRTVPSVSSILGRYVDIIQLDVADVIQQWPVITEPTKAPESS